MEEYTVVGVRFKDAGKIYYFNPEQLQLTEGRPVIVETVRGVEFGWVVVAPKQVSGDEVILPLKRVVRVAQAEDLHKLEENQEKSREALTICAEKIQKHGLDMRLVDAEYTFDNSKVIFYFTADGRIDFRNLVKDLASVFKTRIELRQIGVRDEAKMLGGLGSCGRPLCCSTFLNEFEPVSIRMAKDQNLSLNPAKISGVCGRLMCCLRYESDHYHEARKCMPNVGAVVDTPSGPGKVVEANVLKGQVRVQLQDDGSIIEMPVKTCCDGGNESGRNSKKD
ncbi:MAG TPA: stage 0 sporulation protein [Firmicutes bacterium]|jgi:cell fate regulator YaaT (PSP1 superfamily)|nr:stage 0 sporulation protein [Bacillota bacterium]HCX79720.1 stage 0 sporulation protein [Bacillota bacterium]